MVPALGMGSVHPPSTDHVTSLPGRSRGFLGATSGQSPCWGLGLPWGMSLKSVFGFWIPDF